MTKKLLIAAGCSFTDQEYPEYIKNNIFTWPRLVADEMCWDLINVGKKGCSNEYIENAVYDAICDHKERDIIVMCLWTSPARINPFSEFNFNITISNSRHAKSNPVCITLKNLFKLHYESDYSELDKLVANHSLRIIRKIKDICNMKNIPNYHLAGLPFSEATSVAPEEELKNRSIRHDKLYRYLKEKKELIDNWNTGIIDFKNSEFLLKCSHPNQKGQDFIASTFMKKYDSE